MEKIFYENQYIRNFTAEIIDIKELDNKFHIVLDKTAFFPGGGGQCCDLGSIDVHKIIDVYEKSGIVYHITETKPIKIHRVKCSIDWSRREDYMHQHLAQHVLSGSFFNLFNANTVSIHLGNEISTVDICGILKEEQIREAELFANEVIRKNLKVKSFIPTKKELKSIKLRRDLPKTNEDIRVLEIDDLDINACCGVHAASTLDLRMIKIKKFERNKGNTRIEFLAGERAINDCIKKDIFIRSICRYLNSNEEEAINGIKNLNEELKSSLEENRKFSLELSNYKVKEMIELSQKIGNISVVKEVLTNEDLKYINRLALKLVENDNTITLLALKSNDRVNLIFASSKNLDFINMNELLKDAITLIDGKGGGSKFLAQGAGRNNNNLEMTLDYAISKIKTIVK